MFLKMSGDFIVPFSWPFLLFKKDKTITMEDLLAKVQLKYPNFDITRRHLNRVVNDNNITLKMTRFRHEPVKRFGKEININSKIKEFYDEVKKYNVDDIICIDETSIKSLEKRHHCYSEKGKRCVIIKYIKYIKV